MDIILVRVCERAEGSLYLDQKLSTTDDEYIAISHVWGSPNTVQKTTIDGISWEVSLSPGKRDILSLLRRDDICGDEWFWMDLFCINQTESSPISIADQLMSIPAIYKSSQCVKVLLESPVCTKWQETAMQAFERGPIDPDVFQEEELAHGRKCANFTFMDPWFERLWTRQEGLYACVLHFVVLKPVECQRLIAGRQSRPDSTRDWVTHGSLLSRRFRAETFLLDKLAYHGLKPSKAASSLFSLYFDVLYRNRVNVTLAYDCETGPYPRYNPVVEVWRSSRFTTKPRDYVLAVFPDIDGYAVPQGARKMRFSKLLLNAIGQLSKSAKLKLVPKVPRGLQGSSGNARESMLPWLMSDPEHIGEAYDGFTAYTQDAADSEDADAKSSNTNMKALPVTIQLRDIDATPNTLDTLIKDDWGSSTDIKRHVRLLSPSGPCTGVTRQANARNRSATKEENTAGLLQHHFAEKFMSIAVSQYTQKEEARMLELRTQGVDIPSLQTIRSQVTEEVFSYELKRFLVCLICGVSLPFADKILEVADVVRIRMSSGTCLLGVVHRQTKLKVKEEELRLVSGSRWDLQGFYIARCIEAGVSIRGRTVIPSEKVWNSMFTSLSK